MNEETAKLCIPEAKRLRALGVTANLKPEDGIWVYDWFNDNLTVKHGDYPEVWLEQICIIPDADWAWNWLMKSKYEYEIANHEVLIFQKPFTCIHRIPVTNSLTCALLRTVIWVAEQEEHGKETN